MRISVKLIATLREKLPEGATGNTCEIEIPEGTSVEDVLRRFDVETDKTNVILVNGHSPAPDQALKEGDLVCAFPAMAGG